MSVMERCAYSNLEQPASPLTLFKRSSSAHQRTLTLAMEFALVGGPASRRTTIFRAPTPAAHESYTCAGDD
jgi:hypothetical protein